MEPNTEIQVKNTTGTSQLQLTSSVSKPYKRLMTIEPVNTITITTKVVREAQNMA